jgi:hypothetical protein
MGRMSTKKTMPEGPEPADEVAAVPTETIPPDDPPDPPNATHVLVRALHDGHRRAGRAWTAAEQRVSVEEFTDGQLQALTDDPRLVVAFADGDL